MAGGTINVFKVHYHFESGGRKTSPDYIDYVSAADGKYDTLKTVLSNNGLLRNGTLQITSVSNVGGPGAFIA